MCQRKERLEMSKNVVGRERQSKVEETRYERKKRWRKRLSLSEGEGERQRGREEG